MVKKQRARRQVIKNGWVRIPIPHRKKILWYFYKNGVNIRSQEFLPSEAKQPKDKDNLDTVWVKMDLLDSKASNQSEKGKGGNSQVVEKGGKKPEIVSLIKAEEGANSSDQQVLEVANSPNTEEESKTPKPRKGKAKKTKKVGGQSLNQAIPTLEESVPSWEEFCSQPNEKCTPPILSWKEYYSQFQQETNTSQTEKTTEVANPSESKLPSKIIFRDVKAEYCGIKIEAGSVEIQY